MKKCKQGYYYCYTDEKCKPISKGLKVTARFSGGGREPEETGIDAPINGNNQNGNGNGNGGSDGGNGGGMGESIIYEKSNPRIPRKKGQPANSKKHSDLYTDENPKGTIHGLGFKDVATAKASVSKIRNSSRSHAHKIQAAVAMEQRAREMGKTSEAAVYRKYINSMKKKTEKMNEGWSDKYKKSIDCNNPKGFSQKAHCQGRKKVNENTITEKRDGKSAKSKGYSLRDWFKGGGWVQAGGKYDGKPCAKQPGQKTKPFCRDADDRASMSKDERERRAAKKRREDPNPERKGAAKIVTDSHSNWREELQNLQEKEGKKDACYHKVKSRYSVWPSAYASGALVKCRKVGAANWGNKTKKESYEISNWRDDFQPTDYETVDIIKPEPLKPTQSVIDEAGKKCWKGYKKAGTQKLFGKTYNRCVKAHFSDWRAELELQEGAAWTKKSGKSESGGLNEKGRKSYERENPGSDLKAPSKKVGNPRRKSFCARMKGMKKKLTSAKTANDPDSRINKSLRAWNC